MSFIKINKVLELTFSLQGARVCSRVLVMTPLLFGHITRVLVGAGAARTCRTDGGLCAGRGGGLQRSGIGLLGVLPAVEAERDRAEYVQTALLGEDS